MIAEHYKLNHQTLIKKEHIKNANQQQKFGSEVEIHGYKWKRMGTR